MSTTVGDNGAGELATAVAAVGLRAESATDSGVDLILVNPAGGHINVEVKRVSLASVDGLERRIGHWTVHSRLANGLRVVVADRVTEHARQLLREAGWGWLDLRGHLHLVGDGIFVDSDLPNLAGVPRGTKPLAGRVGAEVAAVLLLDPNATASVREIARTLKRAPSSVSEALTSMQAAGLIDESRRPVTPELFWELADHWHGQQRDLQSLPTLARTDVEASVNDVLRLGMPNIDETIGWALTDTRAAAAYGAPIGVRPDYPPDIYVPDQSVLRRALQLLGPAPSHEGRAASIRVAPVSMACEHRVRRAGEPWPLTRPLFVALDLARDPGRGREILAGWTPPAEAGPRVW